MSPRTKKAAIVFLIIAIASFFRLYSLKTVPPGLYPDEAMNGNNALEAIRTGNFKVFYPENNGREGLFINIQAFFLNLIGKNEPWILRLPSALFGIFTVLGIYFLTRELFRGLTLEQAKLKKEEILAYLAGFFAATSFWHITFSRIGFRAITSPFFLVWTANFLIKGLREKNGRKSLLFVSVSAIFYGLGFYSYIAYRITPILILIGFWLFARKIKENKSAVLKKLSFFIAISFIVSLPLWVYFLNHPQDFLGRTSQISIFNSPTPIKDLASNIIKTAGMLNFRGDYNWRQNISGQPLLGFMVGVFFLTGLYVTFRQRKKTKDSRIFIFLIAWLVISAIPVVISNEGIPHALRAIIMIPPIFIISAVGAFEIFNWISKSKKIPRNWIKTGVVVTFLFILTESYYNYFVLWAKNPEVANAFAADYVSVGNELRQLPKEISKYVLIKASGVDVRGFPMPAETVMFITDTFERRGQIEKNIYYILPNQIDLFPQKSIVLTLP
jgi:4-amino-4-deoxy-L-arabinose transferase-like glycosyltransferase